MEDAFVVAIPSYQRSQLIATHTLAVCNRGGISNTSIYIFIVANDTERASYAHYRDVGYHIVEGPLGLCPMRNFIHQYFEEGQRVVCMDDDIESMVEMRENCEIEDVKSCQRYPLYTIDTTLDRWFRRAFEELERTDAHLFGIYPVKNGYFMKSMPAISYDLRFCVGAVWGMRNCRDCKIHLEEKEDVERTLWFWEKDTKIVRFNHIAPVTKYYKTKGGMQSSGVDRKLAAQTSCTYLIEKYPQWCKLYTSKKSGMHEIRLRA